jgi:hypothetical protein
METGQRICKNVGVTRNLWAFGLGEAGMSDREAIYLVEITNTK